MSERESSVKQRMLAASVTLESIRQTRYLDDDGWIFEVDPLSPYGSFGGPEDPRIWGSGDPLDTIPFSTIDTQLDLLLYGVELYDRGVRAEDAPAMILIIKLADAINEQYDKGQDNDTGQVPSS